MSAAVAATIAPAYVTRRLPPQPMKLLVSAIVTASLALGCCTQALAQTGRVFTLADDQGQRHHYAAYRETPWPAPEAERGSFAEIAAALKTDRALGIMMIAPDRAALERAERALSAQLRERMRRLAIRQQVGPLAPVVMFGRRER